MLRYPNWWLMDLSLYCPMPLLQTSPEDRSLTPVFSWTQPLWDTALLLPCHRIRIMESPQLQTTFKIIKSNCPPDLPSPITKPRPLVLWVFCLSQISDRISSACLNGYNSLLWPQCLQHPWVLWRWRCIPRSLPSCSKLHGSAWPSLCFMGLKEA